jgi:hypothetical protein
VTISVSPARLARLLTLVVCALVAAGLGSVVWSHVLGERSGLGLIHLFDLDNESTVPSWYSSSALLAAAGLLGLIARVERERASRDWRYWTGLAVIFALLSVDEAASIHELAIRPLRLALGVRGVLAFAWVIPGAALVALVGAIYLGFLFRLPAPTRWRFVLAGGLFVGGALGLEMVGGALYTAYGMGVETALESVVEEALEMAGIVVFIHALLVYLGQVALPIAFRIEPSA